MHIKGALRLDCDLGSLTAPLAGVSCFGAGIQRLLKPPAGLRRECGQGPSSKNQF
jgi:hypothetical protein